MKKSKKKDIKLLIIVASVSIIILVIFSLFFFFNNMSGTKFETKSSSGEVTIDITPRNIINNKVYLDITVNTHSIELSDYDLAKLTTLYYNNNELKPISVPKLSGHHSSGVIIFDNVHNMKNFKICLINP